MELEAANYFASYEDLKVHGLMLVDNCRTQAYKDAIFSLGDEIKDKVVMDVGAGTGILSVLCAQAGARKVYAVEASDTALLAHQIVADNSFSHIIEVLHSRVEDVELAGNEKVDVIVSEWMGFYLLHEGMLDSVIAARDKHLKEGGRLLPDVACLYACPCSLPQYFDFWADCYGVNMAAMGREMRKVSSSQPEITQVGSENLLSEPVIVHKFDLNTLELSDLDTLTSRHVVSISRFGKFQGLCLWFTCTFPSAQTQAQAMPVVLSTSPNDPPTHWKQTAIVLPDEFPVDKGEPIAWALSFSRNSGNPRQYLIQLTTLDPEGEDHPVPCDCHMTKCIVVRTLLECQKEPEEDHHEDDLDFSSS